MSYFVYILYSDSLNKFYIGTTGDFLQKRLRKHNSNHSGFTGKSNDWKLVYQDQFLNKSPTLKRDKSVKKPKEI